MSASSVPGEHLSAPAPAPERSVQELLGEADLVRIELPDLNGVMRGKIVAAEKFTRGTSLAFPRGYLGVTVDDRILDWDVTDERQAHGDMLAVPDWGTARHIPTEPRILSVICDGVFKDGTPDPANPRSVLKRVVADLGDAGYTARVGVEFEFWCFRAPADLRERGQDLRPQDLQPVCRQGRTYELSRWPEFREFGLELVDTMRSYGAPVETLLAEGGSGLLEVAFMATDPVAAADAAVRFKLCAREVAARHGLLVSFMAKLRMDEQGSSGHLHQSLLKDGENVFWAGEPDRLSPVGDAYLAGLLQATHECGAFMAPFPNSYRRFDPNFWAPDVASWAYDNRHVCIRAIVDSERGARFEQRRPGADMQPYLSIAASLAGGLFGIIEELKPPPPADTLGRHSDSIALDRRLRTAVRTLKGSSIARSRLGSDVVDLFAIVSEAEADAWERLRDANVPDWEINRYMEVV